MNMQLQDYMVFKVHFHTLLHNYHNPGRVLSWIAQEEMKLQWTKSFELVLKFEIYNCSTYTVGTKHQSSHQVIIKAAMKVCISLCVYTELNVYKNTFFWWVLWQRTAAVLHPRPPSSPSYCALNTTSC